MGVGPDAVDYAFGRPRPADLAAAGIKLVCRYLSHDPDKNLTAPEAAALHATGLGIEPNWESDAGRPLLGATAGTQDGQAAAALGESIGIPHGCTIVYSCDRDVSAPQLPTVGAYYAAAHAATSGRYGVGAYAEADVIDYLHGRGLISCAWQTYAWSGGRLSPNADLYQYRNGQTLAGVTVDFDRIVRIDRLGAWWPGNQPPGGTMPLDDADKTWLDQHMRSAVAAVFTNDPQGLNDLWVKVNALPADTASLVADLPAPPLTEAQLAAIAAAVVAALPPASGGAGISKADVAEAVAGVLGRTGLSVAP